jgi:hypothetical protein
MPATTTMPIRRRTWGTHSYTLLVYLSVCLSVCLSICLSVFLSFCLSVFLSLSVCLSVSAWTLHACAVTACVHLVARAPLCHDGCACQGGVRVALTGRCVCVCVSLSAVSSVTCDANAGCSGAACVCNTNFWGTGLSCARTCAVCHARTAYLCLYLLATPTGRDREEPTHTHKHTRIM